jgi:hypothetical protein|tara:strand:+ start:1850 stop:2047 length:198 start_codon:yes stop_codon:yes gene_type:complete
MGKLKEHAMGELDSRPQVMSTAYPPEPKDMVCLIEMRVRNAKQRIDYELEELEKDLVNIVSNAIL